MRCGVWEASREAKSVNREWQKLERGMRAIESSGLKLFERSGFEHIVYATVFVQSATTQR
jgi:hypothetical protein